MSVRISAQDAADFLLAFDEGEDGGITNLKLQKLLYYAQGFYSALHPGESLFPERIEAWDHGPVVVSIYHAYKSFGKAPIENWNRVGSWDLGGTCRMICSISSSKPSIGCATKASTIGSDPLGVRACP